MSIPVGCKSADGRYTGSVTRNPVNSREALAELLPLLRKGARLSQAELARLSTLSRETINLIERAATTPKADTLRLLASGLATDGDDEIGIGTLTREWNGHPEGAVIVSGLTVAGYPFAVSREA